MREVEVTRYMYMNSLAERKINEANILLSWPNKLG